MILGRAGACQKELPDGVASTPDEVVTAADRALYHAKQSGRDRVSVHRGDEIVTAALISTDAI
jgi:hypothetical protein